MLPFVCTLSRVVAVAILCLFLGREVQGETSRARRMTALSSSSLKDLDLRSEPPLSFREKVYTSLQNLKSLASKHRLTVPVAGASGAHKKKTFNGFLHQMREWACEAGAKKRLLILMSDTGGGHRASAQAIDQALRDQFPGKIDVTIQDIWTDHAKWPFNKFVPMYRFVAKRPLLWRAFYAYGSFPLTKSLTELDSQRLCFARFKLAIEAANPDLVLSVHPLCQLIPISIVRELNKKRMHKARIPFVTVVTDLGSAHRCWFDRRADAVYVPSEAVRDIALRNSIDPRKILMRGLPIRPPFWRSPEPKERVRRMLGIEKDSKTVLLMGGGDGVGGLGNIALEIARKLHNLDLSAHLIVICGHNKKLRDQLQRTLGNHTVFNHRPINIWDKVSGVTRLNYSSLSMPRIPSKLNISIKGFVTNIDQWMGAADLLVTKAGPGTIAEAMTRGLPMVLSSFLPGQESGNVPYVVNGGFGVYTGKAPRRIASKVCELVSDESLLSMMSKRARELSTPEATRAIAAEIASVLLNENRY